ncbi:MAG: hypothetical protein WEC35_00390 [Nitrosopumilaceae archaeon]
MGWRDNAEVKRKKTQTITFRLVSLLLEELKKEAELEKTNLNSLVSKILSNHINWERYERKAGLLPMTKPFVKYAISSMNDKQIINLAQKIEKEAFRDILIFTKGSHSLVEFIEILRSWLNVAWMQHYIEKKENSYSFIIQHDLGRKWSLYVKTMVSELSHDILKQKMEVKTTGSTVAIVFTPK